MDIQGWNERYRAKEHQAEENNAPPTPLLVETAQRLPAGKALDLACGAGRNALWLAANGWTVTAVDGSSTAVELLRREANERGLPITTQVADLQAGEYPVATSVWNLVVIAYYLQRDLFGPAKAGVVPGGLLLAIVHISEPGEEPKETRLERGQLATYFAGWDILHYYEGKPNDPRHRRAVAEIVARRPLQEGIWGTEPSTISGVRSVDSDAAL